MQIEVGRVYREIDKERTHYLIVTKIDEEEDTVWFKLIKHLDYPSLEGMLSVAKEIWVEIK